MPKLAAQPIDDAVADAALEARVQALTTERAGLLVASAQTAAMFAALADDQPAKAQLAAEVVNLDANIALIEAATSALTAKAKRPQSGRKLAKDHDDAATACKAWLDARPKPDPVGPPA